MLLFGKKSFAASPASLAGRLLGEVAAGPAPSLARVREWLVFAGQLEQAVLDAGDHPAVAEVTAHAAALFLAVRDRQDCRELRQDLMHALSRVLPHLGGDELEVRVPEGFAWYALYPDAYACTAQRWAASNPRSAVSVIGLRSIGTSLSAVVAEQLKRIGHQVTGRTTLRPEGYPFRRQAFVPESLPAGDAVIIVDEGPGLSGSSMAGLAEALHAQGVPETSIIFFPGHGEGPGREAGPIQRRWWERARCWVTPMEDMRPCGANPGVDHLFVGFAAMDGTLQTTGAAKCSRQERLAGQGLALPCLAAADGWMAVAARGTPLTLQDREDDIVRHLASYIAHAANPAGDGGTQVMALERISEAIIVWAAEALPGLAPDAILRMKERVGESRMPPSCHGDGRLGPEGWVRLPGGRIVKRNATGSDLDHCWTGSQSVLWDVAGAAVEWQMTERDLGQFLRELDFRFGISCEAFALAFHRAGYCCLALARAPQRAAYYEAELIAALGEMESSA